MSALSKVDIRLPTFIRDGFTSVNLVASLALVGAGTLVLATEIGVQLGMVFGGCCSNVWTYEHLLLINPRIGSALTFAQMCFVTLTSLPSFLSPSLRLTAPSHSAREQSNSIKANGHANTKESKDDFRIRLLRPREVPLSQWALQVVVLTSSSLLNNWAYAWNIPLEVMIVLRSGGLPMSMLLGLVILKRRYTVGQVFSVALVTAGIVLSTLSRSSSHTSSEDLEDVVQYATGIAMLLLSLLLSGILGILQERTYKKYGPCWQEGVFYTHLLSIPIFLFLVKDVKQGFISLTTQRQWAFLVTNLITQMVCVSGVNKLTSRITSVATNLVLTTRKAISLCLSVRLFSSGSDWWNPRLMLGAGMVFSGSALFGVVGGKGSNSIHDKENNSVGGTTDKSKRE